MQTVVVLAIVVCAVWYVAMRIRKTVLNADAPCHSCGGCPLKGMDGAKRCAGVNGRYGNSYRRMGADSRETGRRHDKLLRQPQSPPSMLGQEENGSHRV